MTGVDDRHRSPHPVERILDVEFEAPELLRQALVHRSFTNEAHESQIQDNERLEFLGDAVLDFMVADLLFSRYPGAPEGRLTRLRSALVRTETLAGLARSLDLGTHLLMGRGEENTGGRNRDTNLCAAFEALVGALYLDQGLDMVRYSLLPRIEELLEWASSEDLDKDARSLLQEWSQAELDLTPVYKTISEKGPDHAKEFVVEVLIGGETAGVGSGKSKQAAAQAAAAQAFEKVMRSRNDDSRMK